MTGAQVVSPTLIALPTFPPELMLPVEIAPPFAEAVATPPLPEAAMSVAILPPQCGHVVAAAAGVRNRCAAVGVEIDDGLVQDIAAIDGHAAVILRGDRHRHQATADERNRQCRTQNHTREFHLRRSSPSLTG